jgi:hypothetical protein
MSENHQSSDSTAQPVRKPYSPPRLVAYGRVKDIVQGANGTMVDGGAGNHSKQCWIAETLYGVDDPRTELLRAWLTVVYEQRRSGWRFVALYRACGRSTARLIARGVLSKRLFRPLFDTLVDKALDESARAFVAVRH